ncbi:hypothetical protein [Lichenifustis flavocetrariae]|uniref:Uncharacterized protein n=1 Tax=Lichenifustis flavocetrariae TaxID=2949735 RepID=A0AA41YXD6_9HYPH|nr:hypothetical protein [Lichenifustis flavocetrariae]MCW6510326.1 hypothetical protein [Lichenifustis flavocetrariae]
MGAEFTELEVLSYRQQLPLFPEIFNFQAVLPSSVAPFLVSPFSPDAKLAGGVATGAMIKLRLEIQKDGATFWVGAAVPEGTTDFSRCYIYFYPDTLPSDGGYKTFSGGTWTGLEKNYLQSLGAQMAAAKKMTLIVPYTTNASHNAKHNLFASLGVETLNDIMTAIQMEISRDPIAMAVGEAVKVQKRSLKAIGVASFSSGVNHLNRFVNNIGSSGLIREIIDFDGQHIRPGGRPLKPGSRSVHLTTPVLSGAVNWWITQNPHPLEAIKGSVPLDGSTRNPLAKPRGWIYIPSEAFSRVSADRTVGDETHDKIGRMMLWTMMLLSKLS